MRGRRQPEVVAGDFGALLERLLVVSGSEC